MLITLYQGTLSSAPSSGEDGDTYINNVTNGYYVYYAGAWQLIATLTPPVPFFLLTETGDHLLQETGDKIQLN